MHLEQNRLTQPETIIKLTESCDELDYFSYYLLSWYRFKFKFDSKLYTFSK